jgi:phosphatidate cytidylyltransferase
MSNLTARLVTALVALPFLVAAIRWSNPIGVWCIVFVATAIGLGEFYQMTMPREAPSERIFATAMGLIASGAFYWFDQDGLLMALTLSGITLAAFVFYLFRFRDIETVARRISFLLSGTVYVALLLCFVALCKKRLAHGGAWVFITLTCAWFSDTGAYFAGRFLGPYWKTPLYEAMSPKKTVVGALGGLAASIGALVLAKLWYLPELSWIDCVLVAAPANVLGQLGDLSESMLKRSTGVKDSGALLPGHGGMLDRIDALLFGGPFIYVYARFIFEAQIFR